MTAEETAPDPTAVMVRRVIAHLIDAVVYLAAALVPLAVFADSRTTEVGESLDRVGRLNGEDPYLVLGDTVYSVTRSEAVTVALIAVGVYLLLAVVMQGLTGRTAGKWVTGVRAVRPDGSRPGLVRAFLRELCWIIDGIPSFVIALVGGILALVTTGHRRVGDYVGRTYVVHRRFAGTAILHPDDVEAADATAVPTGDEEEPMVVAATAAAAGAADDAAGAEAAEGTADGPDNDAVRAAAEPAPADDARAAPTSAATGESTDESDKPTTPRWDPDRRAYISYDPRRGGWLQHDTETGEWGPISRG